jgi:hypothetical protein
VKDFVYANAGDSSKMLLASFVHTVFSDAPRTSTARDHCLAGDSAGYLCQRELLLRDYMSDVRGDATQQNGSLQLSHEQREVRHERQNATARFCVSFSTGAYDACAFL